MGAIFAIVLIMATGNAAVGLLDRRQIYRHPAERFVLSAACGLGTVAFVQMAALAAHLPLTRGSIILLLSPFIAAWAYPSVRGRNWEKIEENARLCAVSLLGSLKAWWGSLGRIERVAACCSAGAIIYTTAACFMLPVHNWDAISTWAFKAKVIFTQKTVFTEDFLDPYRFSPLTSYPLLVPLLESYMWNMIGAADEHLMKAVFALFFIVFAVFMYWTQRRYLALPRVIALVGTACLVTIPSLLVRVDGSVDSAYADFPLAVFYAMTVVYLCNFLRDRERGHLKLSAFFAACALFTKNEAVPLVFFALLIFAADIILGRRWKRAKEWLPVCFFLGVICVLMIPWFSVRVVLPKVSDNNPVSFFLTSLDPAKEWWRFKLIMKLTCREMFSNFLSWGLLWYMAMIAVILPRRYALRPEEIRIEWYMALLPWAYYFFIVVPIYMFWMPTQGHPTEMEFAGMSFERLRFHLLPVLWLYVSARLGRGLIIRDEP